MGPFPAGVTKLGQPLGLGGGTFWSFTFLMVGTGRYRSGAYVVWPGMATPGAGLGWSGSCKVLSGVDHQAGTERTGFRMEVGAASVGSAPWRLGVVLFRARGPGPPYRVIPPGVQCDVLVEQ